MSEYGKAITIAGIAVGAGVAVARFIDVFGETRRARIESDDRRNGAVVAAVAEASERTADSVREAITETIRATTPEPVEFGPSQGESDGSIDWGHFEVADPTEALLPAFESRPDFEVLKPGETLEDVIHGMSGDHDPRY